MLKHFRYTGILTIEFFVRGGKLIANEMAPRVHNSGHWTIEGAVTSQFENHLRAILDLPLGSHPARGYSAMLNLIGTCRPGEPAGASRACTCMTMVRQPRPGRKLGHLHPGRGHCHGARPAGTAVARTNWRPGCASLKIRRRRE